MSFADIRKIKVCSCGKKYKSRETKWKHRKLGHRVVKYERIK